MERRETFSIRQMIELTGLSEYTIRGWEGRYSAFAPTRGETGRREYLKSDVERALLMRELLKRGHRIGKIAAYTNQKLKALFEQTDFSQKPLNSSNSSKSVSRAIDMMALQKWEELEDLIKNVRHKNTSQLLHKFILPVLQLLALNVEKGLVSVSQEHVVSSFIKEKIYSELSILATKRKPRGATNNIRFILATPEGDHHEIGLLLAHLLIRTYGFVSLYLGPHSPAKDLAETALRFRASHILVVSNVTPEQGAHQNILSYASTLQKRIADHCKIIIAGIQSPVLAGDLDSSLFSLNSFNAFEDFLQKSGGKL